VLDDAFRSGFRMATPDAAATPIVARATQGRSNAAVIFNPSTDAIRGQLRSASTGVRFWAKVESGSAPSVYALVGGAARGTVSLTVDGGWHEYLLSFGSTWSGQEMMLLGSATGTAKFLLDDVGLVNPPPPPPPTIAAPPQGYWVDDVTIDWVARIFSGYCFIDANGGLTGCQSAGVSESGPVPVFERRATPELAEADILATGATANNPFAPVQDRLYTHRTVTRRWVPGPTPTTVPAATLYRQWGVGIRTFGPTAFSINKLYGSAPEALYNTFDSRGALVAAIFAQGAIEEGVDLFNFYSTTPPTTTTPPQTTTTVAPTTTTPTRPAPFASYPNYLRSQKLKNDGAVAQCLMPGASSTQSFAAACDSATALLAFTPWNQGALAGYLVKQGNTCLQVDYNAPDTQVLLANGTAALKIGWVPCGSTGDDTVWVPTFVETDASNAGWYQLVPKYGRAGIANPCLNLNIGASQSTQMLVEYTCQGGTHTEERWAPNESFWTAPGGTGGTPTTTTATTIPGTPAGAHLLEDGLPTDLVVSSDLGCLNFARAAGVFSPPAELECDMFMPVLTAGGFKLKILPEETTCLEVSGISLVEATCGGTVWADQIQPDGLKFSLRPSTDTSQCLSQYGSSAALLPCSGLPSQYWYDGPRISGTGPIDSALISEFQDLTAEHSDIGIRAVSIGELQSVASLAGLSQRDSRLVSAGPEASGWLFADGGGYVFARNLFSRGMFTTSPDNFVEVAGQTIRLVGGQAVFSPKSANVVRQEWNTLTGVSLLYDSLVPADKLLLEQSHGCTRSDGSSSRINEAQWKAVFLGAALAEIAAAMSSRLGPRLAQMARTPVPGQRLPQDIAVNPNPPAVLRTSTRSIGRASHDAAVQGDIANLPANAVDVRLNQQQVNGAGVRVGTNRPDLQWSVNGQRYYKEYEGIGAPRGVSHTLRIKANDPAGIVSVVEIP
jgi:hypothetical protein